MSAPAMIRMSDELRVAIDAARGETTLSEWVRRACEIRLRHGDGRLLPPGDDPPEPGDRPTPIAEPRAGNPARTPSAFRPQPKGGKR